MANTTEKITAAKNQYQFTRHVFPADLGTHGLLLNFKKYTYQESQGGLISSRSAARNTDSIMLPLPQNLDDVYGIRVNTNRELGATGALGVDALGAAQDPSAAAENIKNFIDTMRNGGDTTSFGDKGITSNLISGSMFAGKFFARAGLDSVLPGLGAAADVATGTAVNPHTTIDFDGVSLKQHTFNWTLAPRSRAESEALNKIIQKIRMNILPNYKGVRKDAGSFSRALLNYPNLLHVALVGLDENYFFRFKPAMVTNFGVNFGDGDKLSILADGRPAIVRITLSMSEAEIHTQEDYGGSNEYLFNSQGK